MGDTYILALTNISNLENIRIVHLRNHMYRNKDKYIIKDDNIVSTRENSGPTFKVIKPKCETFKRNVNDIGAGE